MGKRTRLPVVRARRITGKRVRLPMAPNRGLDTSARYRLRRADRRARHDSVVRARKRAR